MEKNTMYLRNTLLTMEKLTAGFGEKSSSVAKGCTAAVACLYSCNSIIGNFSCSPRAG